MSVKWQKLFTKNAILPFSPIKAHNNNLAFHDQRECKKCALVHSALSKYLSWA